jgi:uncharacterized RDD family membrane protein YckC
MSTVGAYQLRQLKRRRDMVTPEGIALPISVAQMSSRFGALLLDLLILYGSITIFTIVAILILVQVFGQENNESVFEFLAVVYIIVTFLVRQGYFMFFELGPRGATPGKRLSGIRIAARDGGRLTPEAVIARNLLRDIELFLPIGFLFGGIYDNGWAGLAGGLWFMVFAFFPFFNKDRLRAGDIIAGTWVVDAPKHKLGDAMSLYEGAKGTSLKTGAEYRFGDDELSVYGEYELQTLERILRDDRPEALAAVAETICYKIGWQPGSGDERAFLEAFYAQLRAKLERDMRFGIRKADKHS